MATTAVEKSKTRADLAQLAGRGPFSAISMLAGVLVGYAAFAFLLAGAVAILRANGARLDLSENWGDLTARGGLLLGGLLFGSYLLAGYIAGRMAWRRGAAHGLLVFLGSVLVVGTAAALLSVFTRPQDVEGITEALAGFGIPTTTEEWGDVGAVVWVASLVGMVLGSVLGGLLGERWFTTVSRRARDAELDLRERFERPLRRPAPAGMTPPETSEVRSGGDGDAHRTSAANGAGRDGAQPAPSTSVSEPGDDDFDIDVDTMTKDELYQQAQELDIPGRSQMNKDELAAALKKQHSLSKR